MRVKSNNFYLIFLQEPKIDRSNIVSSVNGGIIFKSSPRPARAAVWVNNDWNIQSKCVTLEQFSNLDQASVLPNLRGSNGSIKNLVLCSIYLPTLDGNDKSIANWINSFLADLVRDVNFYCKIKGDKNDESSGQLLIDFLNPSNIMLMNKGLTLIFDINDKKSVIDIPCPLKK